MLRETRSLDLFPTGAMKRERCGEQWRNGNSDLDGANSIALDGSWHPHGGSGISHDRRLRMQEVSRHSEGGVEKKNGANECCRERSAGFAQDMTLEYS